MYVHTCMKGRIMNKPQIELTKIGEDLGNVSFYTTKFESTALRAELLEGLGKDEANRVIADHKISGEFDFTGVTLSEIKDFLVSTTSVLKKYQNDMMAKKEEDILILAGEKQMVSVREMLDMTKTRTTGEPDYGKTTEKMKKAGKSNEEILVKLQAQLNAIKAVMK